MNLKATEIAERLMERIADYSDEALSELMQAMDEIVTVRPSGNGTVPPAASTAATSSRSAIKYASTSRSIPCMRGRLLSATRDVKQIGRLQSQKRVTNRINSIEQVASSVADALMVFRRNPGQSCVSATPQLKRE
jgi:hypothetical protein